MERGLNSHSSPPAIAAPVDYLRKIILDRNKVKVEMGQCVPDEYPERTPEELQQILTEGREKWTKFDNELMAEREILWAEFQQNLREQGKLYSVQDY